MPPLLYWFVDDEEESGARGREGPNTRKGRTSPPKTMANSGNAPRIEAAIDLLAEVRFRVLTERGLQHPTDDELQQ